jgi:hypothetical protein
VTRARPPRPDPAAVAMARALDELLDLHIEAVARMCRECMLEFPCRTAQLARIIAGEAHRGDEA